MKKIRFSFAAIAFMIAIAGAFAFNMPEKKANSLNTTYHYISSVNTLAALKNSDNWLEENPSCTTGSMTCAVSYNGDFTAFSSFLSGVTNTSQIDAITTQRKN